MTSRYSTYISSIRSIHHLTYGIAVASNWHVMYVTGTLIALIQPSIINTRQIMQLIYSDILVTGRLVSWASGPLYSDVDISDTSSQDSAYLFLTGVSKVQLEFIVWRRDTKYRYSLSKCLTEYFNPSCGVPFTTAYAHRFFGLRALGGHRRMGLRSLVHALGLQLDWLTDWLTPMSIYNVCNKAFSVPMSYDHMCML